MILFYNVVSKSITSFFWPPFKALPMSQNHNKVIKVGLESGTEAGSIFLRLMSSSLENAEPQVHSVLRSRAADPADLDEAVQDPFDAREVFDLVRSVV